MGRYLSRRLAATLFVLLGVSILVFLSIRLVPGDPAIVVGGIKATEEDLERIRERLGLNRPLHLQYLTWVTNVLQGDFGRSVVSDYPVLPQLAQRGLKTFQLTLVAMVLTLSISIPLGVIAARRAHTFLDYSLMIFATVGVSTPVFWTGLLLMYVFSVRLRLLPVSGTGSLAHFILPAVTLALYSTGLLSRMTRASMLEVLSRDYIRTARAKGSSEARVMLHHALRSGLIPVVTVAGLQFGYLLAGAVVTETVFAWPGIGRLLADAIFLRDFPIIQGGVLFIAVSFVLVNLLTDLAVAFLDPRIRYE